jgi:hypothetical protein
MLGIFKCSSIRITRLSEKHHIQGSIRRAMAEMIFQGAAAQNVLRFAPKLCQILGHSRLSAVETARCQPKCLGMKCKTSKVAVQVL